MSTFTTHLGMLMSPKSTILSAALSPRVRKLLLGSLREIVLDPPPKPADSEQFLVGTGLRRPLLGTGMGITWWRSTRYKRITRALGKLMTEALRRSSVVVPRSDAESAFAAILKNNTLNKAFFSSEATGKSNLFDLYQTVATPDEVVTVLWDGMLHILSEDIDEWLFVYPLRGVLAQEFVHGRIQLLSSDDHQAFDDLAKTYPYLARLSLPTVIVTHDAADAQALGQTIAVLEAGRIVQSGTWAQLAAQPASEFVREFLRV